MSAQVADTVEHEKHVFHVVCRDAYLAGRHDADGGRGAMRALFGRALLLDDAAEARRQVDAGVLERVELFR